ncbi:MAG: biotin transporter BioY [Christensenellales bacterium]
MDNTKRITQIALFVALIAVFSQIAIPLPMGVPINLALFAVFICAMMLPLKQSMLAVLIYLLLGFIGVPVFAGFRAGPSSLLGKTGGYLIGYFFCTLLIGILRYRINSFLKRMAAMLLGLIACYTFGTLWFVKVTNIGIIQSLGYCVIPFIPGDIIKIISASLLVPRLQSALKLKIA